MHTLESFVGGRWVTGSGEPSQLHDPCTEEVVAETSTAGIDMAAVLDFGRRVGGPTLRAMSFAERGALLRRMSKSLHARREDLVALAIRNGGNTRSDAKFDIDGATATLMYYAKLGEQLGEGRFLLDGDAIQLTTNPRYVGRHLRTPRRGVALQINAFNFPAWGLAEKAAVALLAGVPVISKPATATALVAWRCVQILCEDDVLPDGALQLLCGGAGDVVDQLGPQDALAFTGSARTGALLRGNAAVLRNGVKVNIEADSLNAAVLGPEVDDASITFDMFVREVGKDITQKAGQKCTAIRRIFVPAAMMDAAQEALIEEIARVRVGDPARKDVRMGPLATARQLADAKAGIERLSAGARIVHGGGRGSLHGVERDRGWFLEATLLRATDIDGAGAVHNHEVFGPLATLIPYDGTAAEACRGVALGQGGLVASAYTDDRGFARDVILGMAPFHGRLTLGGKKVAEHSPGPGTVLPQQVHGGPGRAGGGEELGGLRGLEFYLQRSAVQGLAPLLEKILADGV